MEKLNENELMICSGGNILTAFAIMFLNTLGFVKKLTRVFGGRR